MSCHWGSKTSMLASVQPIPFSHLPAKIVMLNTNDYPATSLYLCPILEIWGILSLVRSISTELAWQFQMPLLLGVLWLYKFSPLLLTSSLRHLFLPKQQQFPSHPSMTTALITHYLLGRLMYILLWKSEPPDPLCWKAQWDKAVPNNCFRNEVKP